MPDVHGHLVAVLRARLEELAAEVETLRASDDLTAVVRQLGVQLGCDRLAKCPVCHHHTHRHAEDCAWTALLFLVEGPDHD